MVYKYTRRRKCAPPPIRVRSASLSLRLLRLPSSCVYRLARPKMLIQGLGCGFQNEATITASIQMPLDLTFHARRELPFQVPANQMHGVPTVHTCPTSSGPAWVGPFSSQQPAIRHREKLFKLEHPGISLRPGLRSSPRRLPFRTHVWTASSPRWLREEFLFPSAPTLSPRPSL